MLIYPPAIALIILAFIGKFFHHDKAVYISVMAFTWAAAIFDFMKTLPAGVQSSLHLDRLVAFARQYLPLFDLNLGWLSPPASASLSASLSTPAAAARYAEHQKHPRRSS